MQQLQESKMSKIQICRNEIFLLRNFLSDAECDEYIRYSESVGYQAAPISTIIGPVMAPDVRNNTRVMVDDCKLAANLFFRARPFLPETLNDWQLSGFNERMRYYRYTAGQKFAPHFDGSYRRNNKEESKITFMIYLNDDFEGGQTRFYQAHQLCVQPVKGSALVFLHNKFHEGAAVISGSKYVLRTDVMYKRA